jgi:hypothetical protein
MAKKSDAGSKRLNKLIKEKFSLTPEAIAAALAQQDMVRAKAVSRGGKAKGKRREAATTDFGTQSLSAERRYFPDFPVGRFEGEPRLVWLKPNIFRHEPNPDKPFRFIRSDGEAIEPGLMYTDGGSIPCALWFIKDLSPWSYAPAFLIHDWLFDLHHCGRTGKSFEDVRDIMLEGVRTLMETKVCSMDRLAFDAIYAGIDSFVARQVWNEPGCHLP